MADCPQCKNLLPMKSAFCPKCGTAIPHSTWVHNVNYTPTYKNSEFYHFIMSILPKERIKDYENMEGGFEKDEEYLNQHPDLKFAFKEFKRMYAAQVACSNDNDFQIFMEFYDKVFFTNENPEPFDFALRFDEEECIRFDRYVQDLEGIMETQNTNCFVVIKYEWGSGRIAVYIFGHCHYFSEKELGFIPPYVKYMLSILHTAYYGYIRCYDVRKKYNEDAALNYYKLFCF